MSWVRLDDQFTDHPKLAEVGPVAGWVYVSGLCYAARYLTDGFVPENIALRFAGSSPEILAKLVESSLWDRANNGYQIHDYLEYNPPASKVKAEREEAKARMQRKNATKQGVSSEVRKNFGRISGEIQPSPSPSPSEDDDSAQALTDLQVLGLFNKPMLDQFNDMWPELSGRRDWIGKAITIARDNGASSPAYALKVLANSLHTGKEPGYVNGKAQATPAPVTHTHPDTEEKSRRFQEACDVLLAEGLHPDTDVLFYRKIDERIEAKYGKQPTR